MRKLSFISKRLARGILAALVVAAPVAQADFIGDAKTNLTLRNFYFNRDFTDSTKKEFESWSQAALLRFTSGYTEGVVGFGMDVNAFGAVKLSGDFDQAGNLPTDGAGKPVNDYSRAGATLKIRYSNTELKAGVLEPTYPVISRDASRVLPQTFEGAQIQINELEGISFTVGYVNKTSYRAFNNRQKIIQAGNESDGLSFLGADFTWSDNWSSSYWAARLEDIYDQHYLGTTFSQHLNDDLQLFGNLSIFDTQDSGDKKAGAIDNRAYGLRVGAAYNGHKFSMTYQKQTGDHGYPLIANFTPQPYLVNWSTNQGFWNKDEKSVQARYDFDFKAIGIPGLTWMSRYTRGSYANNKEWERDIDIGYTLQQGPLKDLSLMLRTVSTRVPGNGWEELRFVTVYPFNF